MDTVPKRVTIAMPTATSSSSAPAVSSIAAMAEAPQMAKPVPISRLRAAPSFIRFPSHVVHDERDHQGAGDEGDRPDARAP